MLQTSLLTDRKFLGYNNICVAEIRDNAASGCGSAWLEHLVWDQGVAGSNPVTPTEQEEVMKMASSVFLSFPGIPGVNCQPKRQPEINYECFCFSALL